MAETTQIRIPFDELWAFLSGALVKLGFADERARMCARLFAEGSRDGVYSHRVNRFPRFVRAIRNGLVKPQATPEPVSLGIVGALGGTTWARQSERSTVHERAIEVCRQHGIGLVALRKTNHWMRGGAYGWQAAEAGVNRHLLTNTNAEPAALGSERSQIRK